MANCRAAGNNEWLDRHEATLDRLVDMLPSGSGIDSGTTLDRDSCTATKLVLTLGFHHMNDGGMHDGWTEHAIIVTPSFDGINLRITGRDRNGIKNYLGELYHQVLTETVDIG